MIPEMNFRMTALGGLCLRRKWRVFSQDGHLKLPYGSMEASAIRIPRIASRV